uniref:Nbl1_Borealin_N domain-containing protein n=1 Tax=Macrostomum lignano TaxID=282301 RepID=A0A1I8I3C5_9PLAT
DAQNRPAPQIRQPSARQSSRVAKAVSFNLHRPPQQQQSDEALESGLQHHKQPKKSETQKSTERQRKKRAAGKDTSQQGITDSQLIEVHTTMVDTMDNTVRKQLDFLQLLQNGRISMPYYREMMKSLLAMQTRTIQQVLDAIQSNERWPQ